MLDMLKTLSTSKKFIVMLAAIGTSVASRLGLDIDPDLLKEILAMAAAFILGQGIADHGKEAAKIAAKECA